MDLDESRRQVENVVLKSTEILSSDNMWLSVGEPCVNEWLKAFKAWEAKETVERAFKDDRMTIRGMGIGDNQKTAVQTAKKTVDYTSYKPKEPTKEDYKLGAIGTFSRDTVSNMKLHYGMKGVTARATSENFEVGKNMKYELGLHDLSATLLTHSRPISDQRKRYTGAVWVFMPVPKPEDLVLFHVLNKASKEKDASPEFRRYVRMIASKMTRIKLAQAMDMHTTYTDIAGLRSLSPGRPKIRYGLTGMVGESLDQTGFDLQLIGLNGAIPTAGRNLTIIAQVQVDKTKQLQFRIFDSEGVQVMDSKESDLQTSTVAMSELKKALGISAGTVWNPSNPVMDPLKTKVMDAMKSVVSYRLRAATPDDIRRRKENALAYKSILSDQKNNAGRGANEIVIAYRAHGSPLFPMFAEQTGGTEDWRPYAVLGPDAKPLKSRNCVRDDGTYGTY